MPSTSNTHALMWWPDDGQGTVTALSLIKEPRKALHLYCKGEQVVSRCPGFSGVHPAIIFELGDKKAMDLELEDPNFRSNAQAMEKSVTMTGSQTSPKSEDPVEERQVNQKAPKSVKKAQKHGSGRMVEMADAILEKKTKFPVSPARAMTQCQSVDDKAATSGAASSTEIFVTLNEFQKLKSRVKKLEKISLTPSSLTSSSTATLVTPSSSSSTATLVQLTPAKPTLGVKETVVTTPVTKALVTSPMAKAVFRAQSGAGEELGESPTEDELHDLVRYEDKQYQVVKQLLLKLFPVDYILAHSVSGKAANSKTASKPQFDSRLYGKFLAVARAKFPNLKPREITEKVHSVQKSLQQRTE